MFTEQPRTDTSQENDDPAMSRYEFTCPECGQEIEVNESMREATLSHGCAVCGAEVTETDFVTTRQMS